jgi:MoxR-vWA-beta-propeller ternary system domain bpX4
MTVLTTFLRGVVEAGRLMLREPLPEQPEPNAAALLKDAYDIHALGVAGEPILFDAATSVAAGRVLFRAAWYFVHPNETIEAAGLAMPSEPRTPAHHLSADLVLRYMPALHRRARALRPGDELADRLAELLRRWPLSGVLADIEDAPLAPPDFAGHAGLRLLYAERLAEHEKPGWFPIGPAMESVELVWQQLGRDTSMLSRAHEVAQVLANPHGSE